MKYSDCKICRTPLFLFCNPAVITIQTKQKRRTLFSFFVFWTIESFDRPSFINNIVQITLTVLLFFMKFNTGLVCILVYVAALIYKFIFKNKKNAKTIFVPALALFCGTLVSRAYIKLCVIFFLAPFCFFLR